MSNLIKIPIDKNINLDMMINLYLDPSEIYIPILKREKFTLNSYVYQNTYFDKHISSVSGYITGSKKVKINNKYYPALKVTNDFKEEKQKLKKKRKITSLEELIDILKDFHLDEIIKKIENKNIKKIIVTTIDVDPYNFNELLILANNASLICSEISELLKILGVNEALIVIKDTFLPAIKNLKAIVGTYFNINVKLVRDFYALNYDKILCREINEKESECLILSTNDIYNLNTVIKKNNYINEVFVTISGNVVKKSMVVKTRIGTQVKELIDKLVDKEKCNYDIYINGLIKGNKVDNIDDYIITRDIKSIIINAKEIKEVYDCLNCGVCVKMCPFNINVLKCYLENKKDSLCEGCGLCNYLCPSNINLREKVYGEYNE